MLGNIKSSLFLFEYTRRFMKCLVFLSAFFWCLYALINAIVKSDAFN